MSAQELRDAAERLRELSAAGPGGDDYPWRAVRENARRGNGSVVSVITKADESVFEDAYCSLTDATYIATMHPGVGLALADWLDTTAERIGTPAQATLPQRQHAFAVARLILGSAS